MMLKSWDALCSPEAAVSILQNVVPAFMNADEIVQFLSDNLAYNQTTSEIWKVWHNHIVEVGSIQDFATTNLIVATVSRNNETK
tara:strand:+ start:850 stop:1101 length:252 start_codon:yes stop_codon:yes gene_type:complete